MKNVMVMTIMVMVFLHIFCTNDKPLPGGYEALPRTSKGEIRTLNAPLVRSGQFRAPVSGGSAPYLLLGDFDGIRSRIVLLFTTLSAIDTATVQQAKLFIQQSATFGMGADWSGTIHPLTVSWTETSVTWKDIEDNFDRQRSFSYTVSAQASEVSADIDANLVNDWKRGLNNYGLVMTFDRAEGMVKLHSSENSSGWAKMELIYQPKAGGLDTVVINVDQDASLFATEAAEYQLQENPEQLVIGNGSGDRFLLQFDVSQLPSDATIHRALLSFSIDTDNSRTDSAGISLSVKQVVSDSAWMDLRAMKLDSVFSGPSGVALQEAGILYFSQTPDVGYMSAMVQRWVLNLQPNYGIVVQSSQYGHDMEKVVFYGAAATSGRRPTLYITYSLPPAPRF